MPGETTNENAMKVANIRPASAVLLPIKLRRALATAI